MMCEIAQLCLNRPGHMIPLLPLYWRTWWSERLGREGRMA